MTQNQTASLIEGTRLNKLIAMIGKRGTQVHTFIQQAAVGCVGHSIMYGDIRPGNALLSAVHSSQRKDSLVKYMEQFGCFKYVAKNKSFEYIKREKLVWDADYAKRVAEFDWAKAKRAPNPSSIYDVADALEKLVDAAHRAIQHGKDIKNASILSVLEDTLTSVHKAQAVKEQAVRDALRANATEDAEAKKQAEANASNVTTGSTEPATV